MEKVAKKRASTVKAKESALIKIEAMQVYYDLELKKIIGKGEVIEVSEARAEHLTAGKFAKKI